MFRFYTRWSFCISVGSMLGIAHQIRVFPQETISVVWTHRRSVTQVKLCIPGRCRQPQLCPAAIWRYLGLAVKPSTYSTWIERSITGLDKSMLSKAFHNKRIYYTKTKICHRSPNYIWLTSSEPFSSQRFLQTPYTVWLKPFSGTLFFPLWSKKAEVKH